MQNLNLISKSWEIIFNKGIDNFGEKWFFIISSFIVHETVFISLNLFLFLAHKYNWFKNYKIQKNKYPNIELVKKCLKHLLISQFIFQWPSLYLTFPLFTKFGLILSSTLPSIFDIFFHIFLILLCEDFLFYWSHRFLHHPSIYKYIHKQHHEFKVSIGIASEYAHPIESIISNVIPFLSGPILVGFLTNKLHIFTWLLWISLRITETIDAHSGYTFPFSPFSLLPFQGGVERHDFHHSQNVGSYGSFFCFWDWIMGTDVAFKQFKIKNNNNHQKSK
eukprot:TRINITY_DN5319_c0_g1_i1.p1 TRINITY_DN5319_c0_g1~~TRINITY_DN5319_c0_g1_i1.p1  ORF type:complete len:277 (-),score=80.07 TRINITY_DN5319_c0_g1_i1:46-876(-)